MENSGNLVSQKCSHPEWAQNRLKEVEGMFQTHQHLLKDRCGIYKIWSLISLESYPA